MPVRVRLGWGWFKAWMIVTHSLRPPPVLRTSPRFRLGNVENRGRCLRGVKDGKMNHAPQRKQHQNTTACQRTAPESNTSREQTLDVFAGASQCGCAFSPSACDWQLHCGFPLAPTARTVCAPSAKLIIEVDGSQHIGQEEYDRERTSFLEAKGYRVLRFWNNDVTNNIEGVMQCILDAIGEKGPAQ